MRIVLPSTFWLDFQGSQALQKACKMVPKWNPKVTQSKKKLKLREPEKHVKRNCLKVGNSMKIMQKLVPEKLPFYTLFL